MPDLGPNTQLAVVSPGIFNSVPDKMGHFWYVDGTNGNDGNDGLTPSTALRTWSQAMAKIDARGGGHGDTVFGTPGSYVETITVNSDGVTLIGQFPGGYERPDIVPLTGPALVVNAQGFKAIHMRFASKDDDVVIQRGNGYGYDDCVLDGDGNGVADGLFHALPSDTDDSFTASEGYLRECLLRGSGGFGIILDTGAAPAVGVGVTDFQVRDSIFQGNAGIDIVTKDQGGGVYSIKNGYIGPRNTFADKNKACYIDFTTTNGGAAADQTGTIEGNFFCCDAIVANTQVKIVGTGFTFPGNFDTVGVVDGSGLD
jgi:hypothetical protein